MGVANDWLLRIGEAETRFCLRANRACDHPLVLRPFAFVSRIGDGWCWLVLALALPLAVPERGLVVTAQMLVVSALGLVTYRSLKERLARRRPCELNPRIRAGTRPLDRFSFPSGHTLHAVSFSIVILASIPGLAWLLVPLTLLIAASRVVLGLHYPSDVLAGALIGASLGMAVSRYFP